MAGLTTPSLTTFVRTARSRGTPVESSIENLISLLKRRQIRSSKDCAIATAYLLRRVVEAYKVTDAARLIERVQRIGQRLVTAQPRELAVGNVVRRVLGLIREEAEEDKEGETSGHSDAGTDNRPQTPREDDPRLAESHNGARRDADSSTLRQERSEQQSGTQQARSQSPSSLISPTPYTISSPAPPATSMFSLLSHPQLNHTSPIVTPDSESPGHTPFSSQAGANQDLTKDFKAEVIEGIQEILDELNQANDQIAGYALEHIHSNETILTYSSSITVQKFLIKAAAKRRFTVVHAEAFPNHHESTHATVLGKGTSGLDDEVVSDSFTKTLTSAGITVILIPDSAIFALMSRVNKVVLGTHAVLADGALVAAAGSKAVARAAHVHSTHVVVLCAVYQLSPVYPFDPDTFMEAGDPSKVVAYDEGDFVDKVDIENPLFDYVPADLVDLYITNIGGYARSYLYRIIQDHYRKEDVDLDINNSYP